MKFSKKIAAFLYLFSLIGCGDPKISRSPIETFLIGLVNDSSPYSLGGTVTGLTGSGLVIQNNGSEDLSITASGSFVFPRKFDTNESYSISILTQPLSQTCSVLQSSGIVTADVNNISIDCIASPVVTVAPSALAYTGSPYTYTQNAAIVANTPTVTGTVTSCSSAPGLPTGLSIHNTTCEIGRAHV